ncbi:MAG: hypothetical protein GXP49_10255 [Deltaproteobacteria bacterium]|nr:hypothetical protein [Deltaproteobacteria bacterium]
MTHCKPKWSKILWSVLVLPAFFQGGIEKEARADESQAFLLEEAEKAEIENPEDFTDLQDLAEELWTEELEARARTRRLARKIATTRLYHLFPSISIAITTVFSDSGDAVLLRSEFPHRVPCKYTYRIYPGLRIYALFKLIWRF